MTTQDLQSTAAALAVLAQAEPPVVVVPAPRAVRRLVRRFVEFVGAKPPRWLVKGLIPGQGLGVVHGQPAAGKTFFVLALLHAVAQGEDWLGRRANKGLAVYVAGEDHHGAFQRSEAFQRYHGLDPAAVDILWMDEALQTLQPHMVKRFIADILAAANGEAVRLVVLDTLARCFLGGAENDANDMGKFVAACQEIAKALDCIVVVLHHQPKNGDTMRGSGALLGAANVSIKVSRSDLGFDAEIEKQKNGPSGGVLQFSLPLVDLGVDEDGDAIEVPVAVLDGTTQSSAAKAPEPLGKNQVGLLEILLDAGPNGLPEKEWLDRARTAEVVGGLKPSRAFQEARKALVKAGRVVEIGDRFYAPPALA